MARLLAVIKQNKLSFLCSKLKSDRKKRNSDEEPVYFTPDDVIITRTSFTKENTLEVEFAVLFPASNGEPPKGIPFDEVIKMVEESEDSIQKDIGGSIESISQATNEPLQGKHIIAFNPVPMKQYFFIILFKRAFKMMKNGVYFIVIALLVAKLFKILIYAN